MCLMACVKQAGENKSAAKSEPSDSKPCSRFLLCTFTRMGLRALADSAYGNETAFAGVDEFGLLYVLGVQSSPRIWSGTPLRCPCCLTPTRKTS